MEKTTHYTLYMEQLFCKFQSRFKLFKHFILTSNKNKKETIDASRIERYTLHTLNVKCFIMFIQNYTV